MAISLFIAIDDVRNPTGFQRVLRLDGGRLVLATDDEVNENLVQRTLDGNPVLASEGRILPADPALRPSDINGIPKEIRATLERQLLERHSGVEAVAIQHAALSAIDDSAKSSDDEASGCCGARSGPGLGILVMILALLALPLRRRLTHRLGLHTYALIGSVGIATIATAPSARAETRCLWGFTAFWDSRGGENNDGIADYDANGNGIPEPGDDIDLFYVDHPYPGWRIQPCDRTNVTCAPFDQDCCYTFLPYTKIRLMRELNGVSQAIVDTWQSSDTSGSFIVCDSAWNPAYTYRFYFTFEHGASPPAQVSLSPASRYGAWSTSVFYGSISQPSNEYAGIISVNSTTNPLTFTSQLAKHWATLVETMDALSAQGETRFRRNFGSVNSYDKITVKTQSANYDYNDAHCSQSTIRLNPLTSAAAHELLHIAHGRVLGCNGGVPVFPALGAFAAHGPRHSGEGVALVEAIGDLGGFIWGLDRSTATTTDTMQHYAFCNPLSYAPLFQDENDAVSEFNNAVALWDLIDAAGDYTNDGKNDSSSVTIKQIFDALNSLKLAQGALGQNRTSKEFNPILTGAACTPFNPLASEEPLALLCADGHVCDVSGQCNAGDPHGSNLRDVISFLPGSATRYVDSIISSQCVRPADDLPPFHGGYREL